MHLFAFSTLAYGSNSCRIKTLKEAKKKKNSEWQPKLTCVLSPVMCKTSHELRVKDGENSEGPLAWDSSRTTFLI